LLDTLYHIEWAQHHFLYYNIQSLDIVQQPRMPENLAAFETALRPQGSNTLFRMTRRWQLTNTATCSAPLRPSTRSMPNSTPRCTASASPEVSR